MTGTSVSRYVSWSSLRIGQFMYVRRVHSRCYHYASYHAATHHDASHDAAPHDAASHHDTAYHDAPDDSASDGHRLRRCLWTGASIRKIETILRNLTRTKPEIRPQRCNLPRRGHQRVLPSAELRRRHRHVLRGYEGRWTHVCAHLGLQRPYVPAGMGRVLPALPERPADLQHGR